ncbi:MAG: AraC family transcriptional regulator [Polaromonas sp.]|nr:MAG: AraC family transcriptional regulator [Polaromonas sp.]
MFSSPTDTPLIRRYDREGGKHVHDHAQVLFGIDGVLYVEVEGHSAWVDATCGLVIPAGAAHTYCAARSALVLVLDEMTGCATQRMRRFALPHNWRQAGLEIDSLTDTLVAASTVKVRRRIDLDALAQRIDADLSHPWTVAELAAACCLSPQRLRARFALAVGLSPLAFVRARRLNRAEQLLRRGLSLDAVACQVGYGSDSALSVALRRERNSGARELRTRRAFASI